MVTNGISLYLVLFSLSQPHYNYIAKERGNLCATMTRQDSVVITI